MATGHIKQPLRIGLTGGIGSGKTTASNIFKSLGVPVIDADVISRSLLVAGKPAYAEVVSWLGPDIVGKDGEIRRNHLRELVFNNKALLAHLESIIHPLVKQEILKNVASIIYPYCIISVPLLLETGAQDTVDRVLVIDVPEPIQLERAGFRDHANRENIEKIMQAQMKREKRVQMADDIIYNDKDINFLEKQVHDLHEKYLTLADKLLEKSP